MKEKLEAWTGRLSQTHKDEAVRMQEKIEHRLEDLSEGRRESGT